MVHTAQWLSRGGRSSRPTANFFLGVIHFFSTHTQYIAFDFLTMSSSFRKLPPEVARELRRHVSPRPLPKTGQNQAAGMAEEQKKRLQWVLAGCVAFTATAASFPLISTWWISNLNAKDDALTPAQVRRGAFNNSGTKDVGRDTNWDFAKGEYKKDAGYYAIFKEEQKKKLPGEFHAVHPDKMKDHEKNIEAFAKGQRRINGDEPRSRS